MRQQLVDNSLGLATKKGQAMIKSLTLLALDIHFSGKEEEPEIELINQSHIDNEPL